MVQWVSVNRAQATATAVSESETINNYGWTEFESETKTSGKKDACGLREAGQEKGRYLSMYRR